MALPIPTSIKNMVIRMSLRYTTGCKITYRIGNTITDKDPSNYYGDETDSEYDSDDNASNTSDPPPDMNNDNSTDDDSIDNLDNNNAAIIFNPYGVEHHGPISGVETNHDDKQNP